MTVSASTARKVTPAAAAGHRDVRGGSPALAGSYPFSVGDEKVTGWHSHDLHQLEFAFEGVAEVETATARYLLPPRQAVWIPAGVSHCTTLTRVRILPVAPVIREMILYARRWPIGRATSDAVADGFFTTLGHLIAESLDAELPLRVPNSRHPVVAAVMHHTDEHLAEVTPADVCAAVGISERTLRRVFLAETGMPWRQYLLECRLLRGMALLSEPGPTVLAVALAAGFGSMSGFARAFRRHTGETPLAYRRRVVG